MRIFLLTLGLVACGGGDQSTASNAAGSPAAPATPSTPAPRPTPAPAAETVGPDGPSSIPVPSIAEIPSDAGAIAEGEKVFAAKGCGGCHQFGSKLVGPDLNGLFARRTVPWVGRIILAPDLMVKQDPQAKKLLAELMVPMPDQNVSDEELPKLLAYIKSKGG
ncbi:MAG: cytochrome c [Deltaproteobacteria bacterium]|nr:cytochrome c [Deltaproteobacteria bacterium]